MDGAFFFFILNGELSQPGTCACAAWRNRRWDHGAGVRKVQKRCHVIVVVLGSRLSRVGAAQSKKRRAAAVLFLVATNQTVHSMVSLLCAAVQAGGLVSSLRYYL